MAMIGAVVYAFAGVMVLWWSLPRVVVAFREYWPERNGSGGLGAVSIGVSEALVEFMLPVVALVALPVVAIVWNRKLAPWAWRSGGATKTLHRAQQWALLVALVVVFAAPVAFLMSMGPLPLVLLPLSGVLWGVAFLLTAAMLATFVRTCGT